MIIETASQSPRRLVLATRSMGKLRELVPMLRATGWHALTLADAGLDAHPDEEGVEAFDTFEANALAKAKYFLPRLGGVVVADDSGLVVDALGGQPGVLSKRWSGRVDLEGEALDSENNACLQRALLAAASAGQAARSARYVCVAAAVWPGGEIVERGECGGELLDHPRGAEGFGYDPFFYSTELGMTFAEADREAKATVSHRGRAFGLLLRQLDRLSRAGDLDEFCLPR